MIEKAAAGSVRPFHGGYGRFETYKTIPKTAIPQNIISKVNCNVVTFSGELAVLEVGLMELLVEASASMIG
jgi:hypothetical protein